MASPDCSPLTSAITVYEQPFDSMRLVPCTSSDSDEPSTSPTSVFEPTQSANRPPVTPSTVPVIRESSWRIVKGIPVDAWPSVQLPKLQPLAWSTTATV